MNSKKFVKPQFNPYVQQDINRFEWETEHEFKYREQTTYLSKSIKICLSQVQKLPSIKEDKIVIKLCEEVRSQLKKDFNNLKRLIVPQSFVNANNYFEDAYKHYLNAIDLIISAYIIKENQEEYKEKIFKSTREFEAGNSNLNLTNYHLIKKVEEKIKSYKGVERNDQSKKI